jgi:hypothetical protein
MLVVMAFISKGIRMLTAENIIDREYLEIRSQILKVAASFDRIERAGGDLKLNTKTKLLLESVQILLDGSGERAERIQMAFSRPYSPAWMQTRTS